MLTGLSMQHTTGRGISGVSTLHMTTPTACVTPSRISPTHSAPKSSRVEEAAITGEHWNQTHDQKVFG